MLANKSGYEEVVSTLGLMLIIRATYMYIVYACTCKYICSKVCKNGLMGICFYPQSKCSDPNYTDRLSEVSVFEKLKRKKYLTVFMTS